ncbi:DMT family transporter [Siminovitchia sp. FSL H7-0308]|uniref:DMT family transporter n=1 Tax=unclassified Siminovitchia TaxID=2837530 RepID=UPI0030D2DA46
MYPYILLMFAVIFYAGNILVGKAINELPPFTITFFRLLTAFIVLLPIGVSGALRHREEFRKHKKPLLIMTVTGIALFNILLYGALQFTTSTKVAVMEGAIPVVTVIMSAYMLKERLNISQWSGILLSMAGAVWVVMNGNVLELATSDWNVGDVIMVGAVITWAIYTIAVKQYMPLFPLYGALLVMSGLSLIMLLPFLLIEWFVMGIPAFTVPTVGGLLYLGIFPSVLALIFYNRAVEILNPSQASIFLNFLPVITMIGAYFWLGETVTVTQIVGALAVIGGVLLTTRVKGKRNSVQVNNKQSKSEA